MFKREGGRAVKKRRKSILMPRLRTLPFAFSCLQLSLLPLCRSRLLPLFPTPATRDRPDSSDQTGLDRPDSSAQTRESRQLRRDSSPQTKETRQLRQRRPDSSDRRTHFLNRYTYRHIYELRKKLGKYSKTQQKLGKTNKIQGFYRCSLVFPRQKLKSLIL